ncbi:MAG: F0F1 ATP synthase subunit epsilon [Rhodospirillaceae bacterium]|nr:F0F1 ATP synthase subunit epsilon [Rhodospirillaceae bacterium]
MRLLVTTPTDVIVDAEDVELIRAEDATGSFGIQPGHAGFLTVLEPSVIRWCDGQGNEHYVAVRGGVLSMRDGMAAAVATREGVAGDDLAALEREVLERYRAERESETAARARAARLHLDAMRLIWRYVQAGREGQGPGRLMPLGPEIEDLEEAP